RLSHQPWIYADVKTVIEATLYLLFLDTRQDKTLKKYIPTGPVNEDSPKTLDASIDLLCDDLPLKTKTFIAKLAPEHIQKLYFTVMEYTRHRLGFDAGNEVLLKDCRFKTKDDSLTVEDAVMEILKRLKKSLEKDHILRVVK
ncbi:MAG: hypothetical protein GY699_04915, partial [Desulfobacteraceae bacterium]|nr:hypothetical protein [Desulfobacteraceae bacterium]